MDVTANQWGDDWARDFDTLAGRSDTAATVTVLLELARGGSILDLAAGTGRVAIPLAQAGARVTATDASPAMIAELRAKPGAELLDSRCEALPAISADGPFAVIAILDSSLYAVADQQAQIDCLTSAAAHLLAEGRLVIETTLSSGHGPDVALAHLDTGTLWLNAARQDILTGRVLMQDLVVRDGALQLRPMVVRLVPPAELDLMARLAGLRLTHRWGSWDKRPLTGPGRVISVYQRDDALNP